MPEHEVRRGTVYDHADDESRPSGRGRRQVADWGVGEELFDGMPGRRFDRRGDDHAYARTGPRPDDRTTPRTGGRDDALKARRRHDAIWAGDEPFADNEPFAESGDEPSGRAFAAAAEAFEPGGRFAEGPSAAPARTESESTVRGGASRRRTAPESEDALRGNFVGRRTVPEPDDIVRGSFVGRRTLPEADDIVRGGVEGRRTVKIGGRPAEFYPAPGRRRPSQAMHERVGPRPDRIAAWAFALGILLILIAIATANT